MQALMFTDKQFLYESKISMYVFTAQIQLLQLLARKRKRIVSLIRRNFIRRYSVTFITETSSKTFKEDNFVITNEQKKQD